MAAEVKRKYGLRKLPFSVGTMIEVPRAAITAGELAQYSEFFSFGTNDLTQTTYGLSRDDAGRFLPWLERFGWSARLDRVMLEQVLKQNGNYRIGKDKFALTKAQ